MPQRVEVDLPGIGAERNPGRFQVKFDELIPVAVFCPPARPQPIIGFELFNPLPQLGVQGWMQWKHRTATSFLIGRLDGHRGDFAG